MGSEETPASHLQELHCIQMKTQWERKLSQCPWGLVDTGHDVFPECSANIMSLCYDQQQHLLDATSVPAHVHDSCT